MCLFKSQIEYLGHLITTEGIKSLTDKIDAILRLQTATTVTEVKHIIGIANYYKKFLPLLSELIRPLHQLTRKNIPFEWTTDCQNSLDCLKHTITSAPILIYPEPTKPYILYTDSSKYTWAGILTQTCVYIDPVTQQTQNIDLPVNFQSGSYTVSQEKWSTLQKEAYAIYASFKKIVFYLRDTQVLIKSDHAPLRKFIYANTSNDRLTAWAQDLFAITPYIDFEHLKGTQNILSDAILRIKRFSFYNEIDLTSDLHSHEVTPTVLPSQENLEVPIFDRDVTWHVNHVNTEIPYGFMLNDMWYETEDKTSVQGLD